MSFNSDYIKNGVNSFTSLSEEEKKRLSQLAIANWSHELRSLWNAGEGALYFKIGVWKFEFQRHLCEWLYLVEFDFE